MKKYVVKKSSTLMETIKCINGNKDKVALVVDEGAKLVGIVTDGDIRRALISGAKFEDFISNFMGSDPVYSLEKNKTDIQKLMLKKNIKHLPIVDSKMKIIRLESLNSLLEKEEKENWVFLFAGGLGERLKPLTNSIPKPLIKVGSKPILEDIINSFQEEGFKKFFISVNYKSEMIEDYFGDGKDLDCEIEYIKETKSLGTAGSISIIPKEITKPLIVMNGDILTKLSFEKLLDFHHETNSDFTACVRQVEINIPFGVVESKEEKLVSIVEKPSKTYNVNAGIYVLNPSIISDIRKNTRIDMPELLNTLISEKKEVSIFPIHEYWIDIGRKDDLKKAEIDHRLI